ncbi:MAG: hypothetical protein ACRED7_02205 [Stellaceae bacterium]
MRCYFMRDGHIGAVEILADTSDAAAVAQAQALFEQRKDKFAGFEVWDRARFVHRYPPDRGSGDPGEK